MSEYRVKFEESIWDVAGKTVGIGAAVYVADLAGGWDNDLSALWNTDIALPDVEVKEEILQPRYIINVSEVTTYTTIEQQTGYDLALQVYGGIAKIFTVLKDNNIGFDEIISKGTIINFTPNNDQKRFLSEVKKKGIKFTTGEDTRDEEKFLITEHKEHVVTESGERILV